MSQAGRSLPEDPEIRKPYGVLELGDRPEFFVLFQAEDGIRDLIVTGVQTCALPISAALVHVLLFPYSRIPTVGASGAIAGVMGAYMIKFPKSRILTLVPIFIFLTTMEIPAVFMLLYWFVIQFFSGIGSIGYSNISRGGVAWFAHVGGFLAGIALVYLMGTRDRFRYRSDLRW